MNEDYEKQLAAGISRELRNLPELRAPDSLADRVMASLERRSRMPWYQRSWQTWPTARRWAAFLVLLALFGGLCLAGWKLSHTEIMGLALHRVGDWFSGFSMIGNTLNVLLSSTVLVVKKLGAGFAIACLVAVGLAYTLCVGLGTIYVRLAFAKS